MVVWDTKHYAYVDGCICTWMDGCWCILYVQVQVCGVVCHLCLLHS